LLNREKYAAVTAATTCAAESLAEQIALLAQVTGEKDAIASELEAAVANKEGDRKEFEQTLSKLKETEAARKGATAAAEEAAACLDAAEARAAEVDPKP
jgi:hypothetical protein